MKKEKTEKPTIKYHEAVEELEQRFPEIEYPLDFEENYRDLAYIVYEDIFNKFIIKMFREDNEELLLRIFDYMEEMASSDDIEVRNLLQVGILEELWSERLTFNRARKYMWPKTRELYEGLITYLRPHEEG